MDTYHTLKSEILKLNQDISSLFMKAKSIPGMFDYSFGDWEKTCETLPNQMREETMRVAIVGPIKSGKSTFLNSIFGDDYVKRGAGVVTSMVTRVRSGDRLRANLYFKTWDEVNAEIDEALVLFPSLNWRSENDKFDIRREKEREELRDALSALGAEQMITQDTRNINNVLLTSYLKGYDTVRGLLSAGAGTCQYADDQFGEHRAFASDEALAVYLRDIQLEINSGDLDSTVEIADCQGSDSPNPLHLAMIQEYLLLTHLIIYVISSRTGLRRADIKFLSMIKKMGILDNTLFVINCDFNEHESLDDLQALVAKVQAELALIKPSPKIYAFSSLFNLFRAQNAKLPRRDRLRFEQWQAERELTEFSGKETARFEYEFKHQLNQKRYALLLKNHLERLDVITSSMSNWIEIHQDILTRDADSAQSIILKVKQHRQRLHQIKTLIENTVSGATPKIKSELNSDVNRFFDPATGQVSVEINDFISSYRMLSEKYRNSLSVSGFSNTLALVFQEFKQSLDGFLTEVINPEVIQFVNLKENRIREYYGTIAGPYEAMIKEAFNEYEDVVEKAGVVLNHERHVKMELPAMEVVLRTTALQRPLLAAAMHYSAKMKTEAVMRLGFYRVLKNVSSLLKKPAKPRGEEALRALQSGVTRMKRETKKSVSYHLKDYRENLKFNYLFKLVEAVARSLSEGLLDYFHVYTTDLSTLLERINTEQSDKKRAAEVLEEMDRVSQDIFQRIKQVRKNIESSA
ncbi:MAG: dynamin family protein [Desulfobacterales bacterium]|nr:MAG: dynamin family protein [Desulfobacterales bacterium]